MREKIARLIVNHGDARIATVVNAKLPDSYIAPCEVTAQILSLIREEIEKVANPYPQLEPDLCRQNPTFMANADGFERCRQKILAQLK